MHTTMMRWSVRQQAALRRPPCIAVAPNSGMLARNACLPSAVVRTLKRAGHVVPSASLSYVRAVRTMRATSKYSCTVGVNSQPQHNIPRMFSSAVGVHSLTMPSLSPTMTHGTISLWKVGPGGALKAGDVLCEVETDKASVGFEMQEDCVLAKILVEAHGPEVAVGMPIALTVEDAEAYAAFLTLNPADYKGLEGSAVAKSAPAGAAVTAPAPVVAPNSNAAQMFSPAARHMTESQGLNTQAVKGTSKGGRISKSDLVLALKAGIAMVDPAKKHSAPKHAASSAAAPVQNAAVAAPSSSNAIPTAASSSAPANANYKDIPNSNMRKVIAKRLTESKATVPHFYTSIECEIDALMALRKTFKKDMDLNISVNDLVIKSAALALRDVPEANAKWNKQGNAIDASGCKQVDISVAVATPNGLITPILTGADKRGLVDINGTVKDLATRARDGKLKPEEYQGGSFSISNLGMYGISSFSAVINPPQACILAVGAGIQKVLPPKAGTPLKEGASPRPRVVTTVTVQLSADRRVVDEATAAQFLQVFQGYLSNPQTIML